MFYTEEIIRILELSCKEKGCGESLILQSGKLYKFNIK